MCEGKQEYDMNSVNSENRPLIERESVRGVIVFLQTFWSASINSVATLRDGDLSRPYRAKVL